MLMYLSVKKGSQHLIQKVVMWTTVKCYPFYALLQLKASSISWITLNFSFCFLGEGMISTLLEFKSTFTVLHSKTRNLFFINDPKTIQLPSTFSLTVICSSISIKIYHDYNVKLMCKKQRDSSSCLISKFENVYDNATTKSLLCLFIRAFWKPD